MKNIVVLVDLSDPTFKVLKQAHALATAFGADVTILHAVAKEPVMVDIGIVSPTILTDPSPDSTREREAQLEEMRRSLAKFGVKASVKQLEHATVETVLAETRNLQADLIVVGSHQHSTLYHLLVGSVAQNVLRHAHCPVLVVPEGDNTANKK